ncbi:MAG: hypothetical protein ABSD59_01750 [Terracidiphilus sp.]
MKRTSALLVCTVLAVSASLAAQSIQTASNNAHPSTTSSDLAITQASPHLAVQPNYVSAPFSRMAFGGGVSTMGVNMQIAVVANRYINLRGVGNFFNYSLSNISTNGFNVNGTLNLATAGAAVDFYPFWRHGFRLSPGVLFYNHNRASASMTAAGGTSFSLNDYTYYSSQTNPVAGTGSVGLHTQNPAATFTTGWGNMIPRRGGHFSFPFEIGAAMIGVPAVNLAFTGGQVCADPQGTTGCINIVSNAQFQSNLQAQLTKYQNDLKPFRFYPILSTGIAYSFHLRSQPNRVAR